MAVDPITTQLTQTAVKQVSHTGVESRPLNYQVEQSGFGQMLDTQMQANQTTQDYLMGMVDQLEAGSTMNAIPANGINVDLAKAGDLGTGTDTAQGNKHAIFELFKDVNSSQNNMEGLMEAMTSSTKKFSTHEIIRMQIFAQHHALNYELVSKFGEGFNKAIQGPFQMQV